MFFIGQKIPSELVNYRRPFVFLQKRMVKGLMKASSILVVLQLRYASDLPERLVKTFLGSPPESVSIGLRWHTKICISIKVPGDVPGLGTTLTRELVL